MSLAVCLVIVCLIVVVVVVFVVVVVVASNLSVCLFVAVTNHRRGYENVVRMAHPSRIFSVVVVVFVVIVVVR
jgi:hypothetical protein